MKKRNKNMRNIDRTCRCKWRNMNIFDKLLVFSIIIFGISFYSTIIFYVIGQNMIGTIFLGSSILMFLFSCYCLEHSTPLTEKEIKELNDMTYDEFAGY